MSGLEFPILAALGETAGAALLPAAAAEASGVVGASALAAGIEPAMLSAGALTGGGAGQVGAGGLLGKMASSPQVMQGLLGGGQQQQPSQIMPDGSQRPAMQQLQAQQAQGQQQIDPYLKYLMTGQL